MKKKMNEILKKIMKLKEDNQNIKNAIQMKEEDKK